MFRSSSFKYAILAVTASAICGFLHSLPLLGAPPTQESLAAAIRGIASLQELDGYGTASLIDLIAGRLWQSGGASLLATGQWLAVFAGWTAGRACRIRRCVWNRPVAGRSSGAGDSFRLGSHPNSGDLCPATLGNNRPARRQSFGSQTADSRGIGRSGSRVGSSENLRESLRARASLASRSQFGRTGFDGGFSSPVKRSRAMAGGIASSEVERRDALRDARGISTAS